MSVEHPTSLPPSPAIRVAIRVKPGASRTKVGGAYGADDAQGAAGSLVVAVQERAVDGKATNAALKALAAAPGVPGRKIRLVSGVTSRDKVVEIMDPPAGVEQVLNSLRAG